MSRLRTSSHCRALLARPHWTPSRASRALGTPFAKSFDDFRISKIVLAPVDYIEVLADHPEAPKDPQAQEEPLEVSFAAVTAEEVDDNENRPTNLTVY